jgi:hypothetical protein
MLTIGHLRLSLPPGYEARGRHVARLVADELAVRPPRAGGHVDRLVVPPVEVGRGASDAEVASAVARAVTAQLCRDQGGEP